MSDDQPRAPTPPDTGSSEIWPLRLIASLGVGLLLFIIQGRHILDAPEKRAAWHTFGGRDLGFSVELPGTAQVQDKTSTSPKRSSGDRTATAELLAEIRVFHAERRQTSERPVYRDRPDVELDLFGTSSAFAHEMGAKAQASEARSTDGFPGLEVKFTDATGAPFTERYVVTPTGLIRAHVPPGASPADAERFLDSLHVYW